MNAADPSVLGDEHLGGLDDRLDSVTGLNVERLGRAAGDRGDDLQAADIHDDFGHHVAKLHRLDGGIELVAGTEHRKLLQVVIITCSSRALTSPAGSRPPWPASIMIIR